MIIGTQLAFSGFCGKTLYNIWKLYVWRLRTAFRSWEDLIWEAFDWMNLIFFKPLSVSISRLKTFYQDKVTESTIKVLLVFVQAFY